MGAIKGLSAYELASMAGAGTPDSAESAGALFLTGVRDAVVEAAEYGRFGGDVGDVAHEIADGAPDVYTHARWRQFVDLAAYQEECETGEWPAFLTDAAGVALYQVAYRLVVALAAELAEEEEEEEEGE